jgi:RTX calcium-binding nonapeptide repeat (4 copies)
MRLAPHGCYCGGVSELTFRGKERMMRRIILLLVAIATTLVVASSAAWAVTKSGNDGPDRLTGTNGADTLLGKGGRDQLFSKAGKDHLLGGRGRDFIFGGTTDYFSMRGGEKNMLGQAGNDTILGGLGSDNISGGPGNDLLQDGVDGSDQAEDEYTGGAGSDVIVVKSLLTPRPAPAIKDRVVCGNGYDVVLADREDVIRANCEKVFRVVRGPVPYEEFYASIPPGFFEGLP